MAKVSPFQKAYEQGYRDGFSRGSIEPSKKIIKNDCMYILGGCLVALKEQFGFGETRLRRLSEAIQNFWVEEQQRKDETQGTPEYERTMDRVKRITGIDLMQYDPELDDED